MSHTLQVVIEDELLATVVEDIALLHSKFVSLDLRLGSKVICSAYATL